MDKVGRSRGGGRSKKSKKSKKSKDFGDVSRDSGGLKKSKNVGDVSSFCGGLKESKDVSDGIWFYGGLKKSTDVGDGCGASLSSSFKRKVLITESTSSMYAGYGDGDGDGGGGIPFGKRGLYFYDPEDNEVMQEMYGFSTDAQLFALMESLRLKHDDIVSPNLRFSYGVEPYNHDSDPRIGSMAIQKQQMLRMARLSDSTSLAMMTRKRPLPRRPECVSLPTPWRKPDWKPVVVPNQEEILRKRYEKWEEQEDELLHARDLRMATRGLACFNLKFKTDYMVEHVLGSQKKELGGGAYYHCNFIGRSKKGSQQRLFFAEVENAITVILCCIVDVDDGVRGCHFCGNEFVHPLRSAC